jgi:PiT family inorganic phosphate transporter
MFSLQTIFGSDKQFYELLDEAADAAHESAKALHAIMLVKAAHFGMPVSTTHSISTAIMGVGFGKNPRKLKFTVIERILWAWVLTIPASGGVAYLLLRLSKSMGWA